MRPSIENLLTHLGEDLIEDLSKALEAL